MRHSEWKWGRVEIVQFFFKKTNCLGVGGAENVDIRLNRGISRSKMLLFRISFNYILLASLVAPDYN